VAQFSFIPSGEAGELSDDLRELFEELAGSLAQGQRAYSGEYRPTLDVLETDDTVEVIVDVAGIRPAAIRAVFRAGVLLIAGEKAPPSPDGPLTFHLVEREFGRFARAVRLNGAFDVQRSHATVSAGVLTITLPKLIDRRGRAHRIAITAASDRTA
jgi:HSP20 family protein